MAGLPRSAGVVAAAATVVYLVDRLSKGWAETRLAAHGAIELLPGILHFTYTRNSGGAFGIAQSAPWFFATATIVISVVIIAAALRPQATGVAVALGMVLGGALGNLTDRALHGPLLSGPVTDFIDVRIWPVFNAADSAIVVGAILLVLTVGRGHRDGVEPTG